MFGKRTAQPGGTAPAPSPAPKPAAAAAQPSTGIQTEPFGFGDEDAAPVPQAAASSAASYAAKPASPAADRLDALAARPKAAAQPEARTGGPGPKATPGFEQLKKAQAVEVVREQSDYYHATKTTIFNALMNTIDLAQLAQLDTKAASEEIRDIVAELVAIKNVSMSVAEQEHLVQDIVNDVLGYDGATLTIRKFKKDKLTMRNLVEYNSISPEGARVLGVIGASRCNLVISGGTGSGKTTLLNTLTAFIDPTERVITCEDAAELQLQQPHVVRLETRPPNLEGQGMITMRDLVKNCLRMRPERIIVGEVRGPEAFDDVIVTQDLFVYEITGEDENGKIVGRHRSTGIARPRFWDRARYYGLERELAEALDAAE